MPALRLSDLLSPACTLDRFPDVSGIGKEKFFSRGCDALRVLLRGLDVAPGQTILVPSFLCRDVVQVFEAASVQMTLYSIDSSGRFDLAEIARKINPRTRAIYIVHYFGFPQQLDQVCQLARDTGIELIEDCAHALFGRFKGRWLGQFGSAAVFSLRKGLPLPDGGALVENVEMGLVPNGVLRLGAPVTALRVARLLSKTAMLRLRWRPRLDWVTEFCSPRSTLSNEFTEEAICAMSKIGLRVFNRANVTQIIQRRRENFLFYQERLRSIALYRELPDGVVPFSFPVMLEKRDAVANELMRHGMSFNMGFPEAPVTGSVDLGETDLSGTKRLAAQILELPLHQDLRNNHLEKVMNVFSHAL